MKKFSLKYLPHPKTGGFGGQKIFSLAVVFGNEFLFFKNNNFAQFCDTLKRGNCTNILRNPLKNGVVTHNGRVEMKN